MHSDTKTIKEQVEHGHAHKKKENEGLQNCLPVRLFFPDSLQPTPRPAVAETPQLVALYWFLVCILF